MQSTQAINRMSNPHRQSIEPLTSMWRLASLDAMDEPEDPEEPLQWCVNGVSSKDQRNNRLMYK